MVFPSTGRSQYSRQASPASIYVVQQPKAAKLVRQRAQRVSLRRMGLNGCPQGGNAKCRVAQRRLRRGRSGSSSRGNTLEFGVVVVDEPQVSSLGCGVGALHVGIVHPHRLLVNVIVRMVLGLAARSVIDHPLRGKSNVRRFFNTVEVDLVPRNGQFCSLNGVYQFQYFYVGHLRGPFYILTAPVLDVPVLVLPEAVSEIQSGTCKPPNQRTLGSP